MMFRSIVLVLVFLTPSYLVAQTISEETDAEEPNGYFAVSIGQPTLMLSTFGEPLFSPSGFSAEVGYSFSRISPYLSLFIGPGIDTTGNWGGIVESRLGTHVSLMKTESIALSVSGFAKLQTIEGVASEGTRIGPGASLGFDYFFSKYVGVGLHTEIGYLFSTGEQDGGAYVTPGIGVRIRF